MKLNIVGCKIAKNIGRLSTSNFLTLIAEKREINKVFRRCNKDNSKINLFGNQTKNNIFIKVIIAKIFFKRKKSKKDAKKQKINKREI
jgi:hypothetical protein